MDQARESKELSAEEWTQRIRCVLDVVISDELYGSHGVSAMMTRAAASLNATTEVVSVLENEMRRLEKIKADRVKEIKEKERVLEQLAKTIESFFVLRKFLVNNNAVPLVDLNFRAQRILADVEEDLKLKEKKAEEEVESIRAKISVQHELPVLVENLVRDIKRQRMEEE